MKTTTKILLCVLSCMIFCPSCFLFNRAMNVEVSCNFAKLDFESYAILPFTDKRSGQKQKLGYNPADAMTDAFETAFIGNGNRIVDRRDIDNALDELKFSHSGDVDAQQIKEIGKLTNSDVIIMGKIRQFQNAEFKNTKKPDKPSKCTTISYSVKAVHVQTGELLWTGSYTKSTGMSEDFMYGCKCDVLKYANKAARAMVKKITKKISKKRKK